MARPPKPAPDQRDETPAGSAAEQRALDRPWRIWASAIVAAAIIAGGTIGLIIIPAGQAGGGQVTMGHAMRRAAGLEAGSPAVPQPLSTASSIPVSQVSWDPAIMSILASGNTRRGSALAVQACAACHGDKGVSQTNFPALAGQSPYAIYKQLHDFRSGARYNAQMTPVAKQLSVPDLAAVSAYYAYASREYAALGSREYAGEENTDRLAREGDTRRRIPACLSCHVNGSGGPIETPVITGQSKDYILAQLNAYADGTRKNDVYGRMRDIARKLTPQERAELARYFEGTL